MKVIETIRAEAPIEKIVLELTREEAITLFVLSYFDEADSPRGVYRVEAGLVRHPHYEADRLYCAIPPEIVAEAARRYGIIVPVRYDA